MSDQKQTFLTQLYKTDVCTDHKMCMLNSKAGHWDISLATAINRNNYIHFSNVYILQTKLYYVSH